MNEFENIGRRLPYDLPPHTLDALQERIRVRTTARPATSPRKVPTLRFGLAAAAVALLLTAGIVTFDRLQQPTGTSAPDLEHLLSTAPSDVVSRAAAENYDDILYIQQL